MSKPQYKEPLSPAMVREVRYWRDQGYSFFEIAERLEIYEGEAQDAILSDKFKNIASYPVGRAKGQPLSKSEHAMIREGYEAGVPIKQLGRAFNIDPKSAKRIGLGETIKPRVHKKLTPIQKDDIKKLANEGMSHTKIARKYGVSRPFVSLLVSGKRS